MSDTFQYREEIDLQKTVDEIARKVQRRVDEAALDKAADTLADFGYVKTDGKSRWLELFGTPERAARTIIDGCGLDCVACLLPTDCPCHGSFNVDNTDYDALLEWLRGDA